MLKLKIASKDTLLGLYAEMCPCQKNVDYWKHAFVQKLLISYVVILYLLC